MISFKNFMLFSIAASTLFLFTNSSIPCHAVNPVPVSKTGAPKTVWTKDVHDFGEIAQGKPVTIAFKFTNTGDAPLLIADVHTSCGCTISDYPKDPIAAGKSSSIKITYNANAVGIFTKTITVKTNEKEETKLLTIKGTVK